MNPQLSEKMKNLLQENEEIIKIVSAIISKSAKKNKLGLFAYWLIRLFVYYQTLTPSH